MTNTGPARPTDRDVARLGQLQNALVGRRLPVCGDATARERYQRTCVSVILGQMRSSRRCADDTRSHRLAAVKDFDVNPFGRHAEGCERLFHVCHEASRPAEVDIRLWWDADLVEDRSRQVTGSIEILSHLVARVRPAVTNIAAAVREHRHEAADFGGEWMCRAGRRQRVQHRQNRRRPDSRAEQHHRPLSGLQNEAPARRADVESIAHPDMLPQVGSSRPIRLDLHADSIALRREGARERVAAKKWRAAGGLLKTQHHVLAGQSCWQWLTVRALHRQREDVRGLVIDCRHRERPKSWCRRMRSGCRREPRVPTPRGSRLALQ